MTSSTDINVRTSDTTFWVVRRMRDVRVLRCVLRPWRDRHRRWRRVATACYDELDDVAQAEDARALVALIRNALRGSKTTMHIAKLHVDIA